MGHGPTWRSSCDSVGWHLFCSCLFMVHFPNRLALPLSTSAALSWVKLVLELRKKEGRDGDCFAKSSRFWCRRVKMGSERQGMHSRLEIHTMYSESFLSLHNKMLAGSCVDNAQPQHVIFYLLACTGILSNGKSPCLRYKVLELQPSHGSGCASSLLFVLLKAPANFADAWKPIVAFQNSS